MDIKIENKWDVHWRESHVISDYHLILYSLLSEISNDLPSNSKILEVGCGTGLGLSCFKNHKRYGIDTSKESIRMASKHGKIIESDAEKIPFGNSQFDFTYSSGLIEHFKNPSKIIREMLRVTRNGGKTMIIVPNKYCWFYQIYKKLFWIIEEEPYSLKEFKALFNGYYHKEFFGLHAFPPLASSRTEFLPIYLRKAITKLDKILPFKEYYGYAIGTLILK